MASKQLYELDSVTLPLKDDDLLLVSQKSAAEKANFSRKATVANIASKVQENVATQIDNAKYEIQLESDNRYAAKVDVYTKVEVDAFIAMVNPSLDYLSKDEAAQTYAEKWLLEQNVSQLTSDLQAKITQAEADVRYESKGTSYSKSVIDGKFSALSDNFPSRDEVCTIAEVDVKINALSDVYAKNDDVCTSADVDDALSSLSAELTAMIDDISPFEIQTFNNDSTTIVAKNCKINYVGMYENNSLAITLPGSDENKMTEFYIVVDNTSHNTNVQLVITPQAGMKLVSANEQCFDDVPAWKVGYLHFKQMSNQQLLKVDRSDLAVVIDTTNAG